jgi:DNA polymerase
MFALEDAGIPIVATVHDEIIAESESDRLEEGIELLTKEQSWRKGLPLAVEGFVCKRYRK